MRFLDPDLISRHTVEPFSMETRALRSIIDTFRLSYQPTTRIESLLGNKVDIFCRNATIPSCTSIPSHQFSNVCLGIVVGVVKRNYFSHCTSSLPVLKSKISKSKKRSIGASDFPFYRQNIKNKRERAR